LWLLVLFSPELMFVQMSHPFFFRSAPTVIVDASVRVLDDSDSEWEDQDDEEKKASTAPGAQNVIALTVFGYLRRSCFCF
jgi:hypothetical protein